MPTTDRIDKLPKDHRGYPVFFTVSNHDGKPDFSLIDPHKVIECARFHKCGVCGQKMGAMVCFIGGEQAAEAQTYADAPMHRDCALAALKLCPYLFSTERQRAKNYRAEVADSPGFIEEKPKAVILYTCKQYQLRVYQETGDMVFHAGTAYQMERFEYGEEHLEVS